MKDFSFMNNGWSLIAVEGEEKFDEGGLMWRRVWAWLTSELGAKSGDINFTLH